ncbi:cell division protein FtsL [Streptomyces sp. NPDC051219]|uniref:cell division protein FtsL n=1 Tax=Streptomyces sp. NPDC051219 TaxID=3155283 RepID=UPI003422335E
MPSGSATAARTPFVLLVVVLLGGGLITLLLLNSALNQGSFQLSRLKKETTDLTDAQQALQRDVDAYSAPDALARRAEELGMVPGGNPVFLDPDGTVRGLVEKATALPSPLSAPQAPSQAPSPSLPATPPASPPASAPATGTPTVTPSATPASAPRPWSAAPGGAPSAAPPSTSAQPTPTPGR